MNKKTKKDKRVWRRIADSHVRHRWELSCDCQLTERSMYIDPTFYSRNGTPICEECGEDWKYVRTEACTRAEVNQILELARAVLDDDCGINENAWRVLRKLLLQISDNEGEPIIRMVNATDGRFYIPSAEKEVGICA